MPRFKEFKKVLPAANLPMFPDYNIDEEAYRNHLRWLMTFDIGGLVISGHAGELESLTPKEKIRVAEIARAETPSHLPMVVGCTGLSTRELIECARDDHRQMARSFGARETPSHLPMVVGCTGLSTRELIECARDAKAAGAD